MSKNLNPCPFYASTDVHEETSFPFYVHCASCRTDGPIHDNADAAREARGTSEAFGSGFREGKNANLHRPMSAQERLAIEGRAA